MSNLPCLCPHLYKLPFMSTNLSMLPDGFLLLWLYFKLHGPSSDFTILALFITLNIIHIFEATCMAWQITAGQPNVTVSSTGTCLIVPLVMSQGILDVVVIEKWQILATKLNFSLMQLSVTTVYTKYGLS